jgi:hypothetical protein
MDVEMEFGDVVTTSTPTSSVTNPGNVGLDGGSGGDGRAPPIVSNGHVIPLDKRVKQLHAQGLPEEAAIRQALRERGELLEEGV